MDPGFKFGTQGPWPVANVIYGQKDGILESPVVAMSTDEGQNRWVATPDALYLLRPGDTTFKRFDAKDGLHVVGNPAHYCNDRQIPVDKRCAANEMWGGAVDPGITALAGGEKDEVFVGYAGARTDPIDCNNDGNGADWCDPLKHTGKIDRVKLNPDGTIQVDRMDLVANLHGGQYWHDRYVYRLAYDHLVHGKTLYAANEHGVTILFPDKFRMPNPGEWWDTAYSEWMGDHLHARVCFEKPCDNTDANQRMGEWRGLAIDANGDMWHAGKWSAGLITWAADPTTWWQRAGKAYKHAFGDPYGGPGSNNPPVFEVALEGHDVFLSAVSVCPDGKVWFGSLGVSDGVPYTIASYEDGKGFSYYLATALGLPDPAVKDLVCLQDGRLAIASFYGGLVLWDPATNTSTPVRASGGLIPSDQIESLELDRMASPPTLHVATDGGAAAIRALP
ncbi:ligand-binding sensor domain-containing protein [Anaeromyxobacter oryzae]|uniref:WD40 repeat domain-containing protein n=1 Tax=Anaeromyxobacter oryzae TaxID=2918170 RepID=UPI0020BE4A30|nr:WD40 repeat domain-containing protein [Anaeromyxobacter oryzae]